MVGVRVWGEGVGHRGSGSLRFPRRRTGHHTGEPIRAGLHDPDLWLRFAGLGLPRPGEVCGGTAERPGGEVAADGQGRAGHQAHAEEGDGDRGLVPEPHQKLQRGSKGENCLML